MKRTSRGCLTHRRCAVESFCERANLNYVQERAAYGGWQVSNVRPTSTTTRTLLV